jgi:glycerol kinase
MTATLKSSQPPYLLGIDQGSSGSRALVMDRAGQVLGYGYRSLPRLHPQPGWAEQDPQVVVQGVAEAITEALVAANCRPADILACGIACQRNTDFVWSARTGQAIANAITWQDLRTLPLIEALAAWPQAGQRRQRLGSFPGPWSSAMHLAWRMAYDPAVAQAARNGELRVGFSGAWLMQALGRPAGHHMDYNLVQQMGLFDFRAERYWDDWLAELHIPPQALPAPVPTLYPFGTLRLTAADGHTADAPVLAMIGNEQAGLFGYNCFHPGDAACSHGTASFVDVCVGSTAPVQDKLNVYYAWSLPELGVRGQGPGDRGPEAGSREPQAKDNYQLPIANYPSSNPSASLRTSLPIFQSFGFAQDKPSNPPAPVSHTFCLEADTTVSGAALRWMRDEGRLIDDYAEVGPLAASVPDAGGVVFVPAFTGLNVPYHDPAARGAIFGLTLGTTRAHLARAFLESLGFQLRAILETIALETGLQVKQLALGGGIAASDQACQIQADLLGLPTVRPAFTEIAARGAALLAGLGAGVWSSVAELPPLPGDKTVFEPALSAAQRDATYARWNKAIERAKGWGD